jgi:hypothetical protein
MSCAQQYGLPRGIFHVFNTILFKNEFQNPQIFQQTISLFPEQSTIALRARGKCGGHVSKTIESLIFLEFFFGIFFWNFFFGIFFKTFFVKTRSGASRECCQLS